MISLLSVSVPQKILLLFSIDQPSNERGQVVKSCIIHEFATFLADRKFEWAPIPRTNWRSSLPCATNCVIRGRFNLVSFLTASL